MSAPDTKEPAKEAPKSAAPPVVIKKTKTGSLEEEENRSAGKAGGGDQKFLPTGLSRAIVLATILASLALVAGDLFADRYDLVPAPNSTNGFMYRIDRLTGAVQFCGPQGCTALPKAAEK